MTSKNEIIIKQLRGSFNAIEQVNEILRGETDPTIDGIHIDIEFVTALLDIISKVQHSTTMMMTLLATTLGVDPEDMKEKSKNKKSEGASWSPEEILKHSTLEDNILKLPKVQLNKKSYAEAKKWIEEAGGSWEGGKTQGFTFPFNAERVFSILKEGKRINLQQEYQFFATPPELADWLVSLAGGVKDGEKVCEPSAGTGAILNAILRNCPLDEIECYEAMPENVEQLQKIPQAKIVGEDWLQSDGETYDKIIANPPFSKNQDIDHVRKMYDRLVPGGTVAAITSKHWQIGSESKCVEFRKWLEELNASVYDIDGGEFKESGTQIATAAIVLTKPNIP